MRQTRKGDFEGIDQLFSLFNICYKQLCVHIHRLNLTEIHIGKIQKWREGHGNFENVEQLLQIRGFSATVADKICHTVIEADGKNDTKIEAEQ